MIGKNNKKRFHEIVHKKVLWRVLFLMCAFIFSLYLYPAIAKEPTQTENEPWPQSFLQAIINDQMVSWAIARLQ
ncbi:MAG: hypothetical protein HY072_01870 [Deltaproteobacteria bacterium]|nr:hypothetical protein [Deltaproteobacteria bacterium]